MRLLDLLAGQVVHCARGTLKTEVFGLAHDSRRVRPGEAFFCLSGRDQDGHDFAGAAVRRGATAVVAERRVELPPAVTLLLVEDARQAMAHAAAAFWGHPSRSLRLVTVTGTNGKTTVNHLIEAIFRADRRTTGLLGTVENRYGRRTAAATLTTPDALDVQSGLAQMRAAGVTHACVEVSSHALSGHRLGGCEIDVAVLTNIARDHLDFHHDVEAYVRTKLSLFHLAAACRTKTGPAYGVLNVDDQHFTFVRDRVAIPILTYGVCRSAHVKLVQSVMDAWGTRAWVRFDPAPCRRTAARWVRPSPDWPATGQLYLPLPGRHNIQNLLAALAVAWAEGCRWGAVVEATAAFSGVRGRWEVVPCPDGVVGVVDFAHNPGGLRRALETARLVTRGRIILVFGCEGGKDRGKRPVMGSIAGDLADHVILTRDNTFLECGERILADIHQGLERGRASYEVVRDRREAIFRAAALARSGDLVMVAGRGHDVRLVSGSAVEILDDRQVLAQALEAAYSQSSYSHSMVPGGLEVTS